MEFNIEKLSKRSIRKVDPKIRTRQIQPHEQMSEMCYSKPIVTVSSFDGCTVVLYILIFTIQLLYSHLIPVGLFLVFQVSVSQSSEF